MLPGYIESQFDEIELEELGKIVLERDKNLNTKFIYNSFKAFLPTHIQVPGLNDDEEYINENVEKRNLKLFYKTVDLKCFYLFIGIIHDEAANKTFVFNCKSLDDKDLRVKVTMSKTYRNSNLIQIKDLINSIANGLELYKK